MALLSAFGGGDKDLKELLEQIRVAQVDNQELTERATDALQQAEVRIQVAEDAEARAAQERRDAIAEHARQTGELDRRKRALDNERDELDEETARCRQAAADREARLAEAASNLMAVVEQA